MYRAILPKDVLKVLNQEPEKYFDEREELEDLMDEDEISCYASDDCVLIFSPRRLRMQILSIPQKENFDLAAMERFVHTKTENFQIHMNVTGMQSGSFRYQEPYEVSEPIVSLWANAAEDSAEEAPAGVIRPLTEKDQRHANYFREGDDVVGMGLKQSFPFLVMDEVGEILGYFDEQGELQAYVSLVPTELDAYSVDSIYVQPKVRRKGIGTKLAKAMIRSAAEAGVAAYWPIAQNEIVQKTAKAAGFKPVSSRITIETF